MIAVTIALAAQLYWNAFVPGFRISTSVILLPILILTLGKGVSTLRVTFVIGIMVLILRVALACLQGASLLQAFLTHFPNAFFYFSYGAMFTAFIPNKHMVTYKRLFPALFISDLTSNIVELCVFACVAPSAFSVSQLFSLAAIALFRTFFSGLVLIGERQYRTLLKKEEHENRYQRLFLMTTGLKNEIYFMRKNSEEIESVMANAYRLYEKLQELGVPENMKQMSLSIARDVHEIKKDYIRIIQGIEEEISEEYDEKHMSFHDILHILEETTYNMLSTRNLKITLNFFCADNFITSDHYELMAVLKNLVNNAIEAIETQGQTGQVQIMERLTNGVYIFRVTDNGPGIPPRHLPNIFKMGYSTKFDYKTGNIFRGVGLYGVKSTVEEKFHGTIEVESELGKGTTFTVRIPQASLQEVN